MTPRTKAQREEKKIQLICYIHHNGQLWYPLLQHLSNQTAKQRFKKERHKQRRWISSVFQQLMVLLWNLISVPVYIMTALI